MKTDQELRGIGGWLALLVFGLTVLGPLVAIGTTQSEISDTQTLNPALLDNAIWKQIKVITWTSTLLSCAISITAGVLLSSSRRMRTVPIVIACLWIAGPMMNIMSLMIIGNVADADVSAEPQVVSGMIRSLLSAALWTAYLTKSRRVENTYNE